MGTQSNCKTSTNDSFYNKQTLRKPSISSRTQCYKPVSRTYLSYQLISSNNTQLVCFPCTIFYIHNRNVYIILASICECTRILLFCAKKNMQHLRIHMCMHEPHMIQTKFHVPYVTIL